MVELRFTLLGEGSSDRALLHVIRWLLESHAPRVALAEAWADLGRLRAKPKTLADRIRWTIDLYPCDLLFVHRDGDKAGREKRVGEIKQAVEEIAGTSAVPPSVCVVPVRMLEAWLLFDEQALRAAAGNPSGQIDLALPPVHTLESMSDPKSRLKWTIGTASELSARRREKLTISAERVAALTDDFSPLRGLSAFQAFEVELRQVLVEQFEVG